MVSTLKNMLVNGDHHPICWMEHERSISSHQTLYHIINVSHPQLCWPCTPDKWLCECMCIFGNAYALRCCLSLVLVLPARLSYYIYIDKLYTHQRVSVLLAQLVLWIAPSVLWIAHLLNGRVHPLVPGRSPCSICAKLKTSCSCRAIFTKVRPGPGLAIPLVGQVTRESCIMAVFNINQYNHYDIILKKHNNK